MRNEIAESSATVAVETEPVAAVAGADATEATPRAVDLNVTTLLGTVVEFKALSRTTSAGALARATANRLNLPGDVAYTLRDESKAEYIDDETPVGDLTAQQLRLVPKAHLGA